MANNYVTPISSVEKKFHAMGYVQAMSTLIWVWPDSLQRVWEILLVTAARFLW